MFPRAALLLLLSSTVLCLTDSTTETAIKETSTMSQSGILLTVTVCVTAPLYNDAINNYVSNNTSRAGTAWYHLNRDTSALLWRTKIY
ncbi:hypothetical protein WN51_04186 [Melipona quadrifasciata]|uniref:Uncharacterized protein n=1 Tax=Melipona quadrifasciata TaxID=166423 RepID=A0A0M8ZWQ1_9HYME|nr:hypothetical protein WN51_04186 [Melipona quadrifasciata]